MLFGHKFEISFMLDNHRLILISGLRRDVDEICGLLGN
jgi:hypothetical protein